MTGKLASERRRAALLSKLREGGPRTTSDLAHEFRLKPRSVRVEMNRLARKGLVRAIERSPKWKDPASGGLAGFGASRNVKTWEAVP